MMKCGVLMAVVCSIVVFRSDTASAQISVGVTRQGGIVTGGALQVGGYVTNGATGVRLGVNTGAQQLLGINTFSFQNGAQNGADRNRRGPKPTPSQFVKAAASFDQDEDKQFNEDELAAIGAAVLAELRERDRQRGTSRRNSPRPTRNGASPPVLPEELQIRAFVKRCLKFDKDKSGTLDEKETRRMAAALIRTL